MEFAVMPDHLYGASVRVNGKWLGAVEDRPLPFRIESEGEYTLLLELTPLRGDLTGDVIPIPFARMIKIKNNDIAAPEVETDGALQIRKSGTRFQLHYVYPKTEALGQSLETLLMPLQTETADFDHDGRLDVAETFVTNLRGHVRVRSATGQILLQEVYPDSAVRIEAADLTRDGRPDLLIFWRGRGEEGPDEEAFMQLWDPVDGALSTHLGFTGIRRTGRGEALVEKTVKTPFRQVTCLYRYHRQPGESAQFQPVRVEERTLLRADDEAETAEAFLSALETKDTKGAELYLANGTSLPAILRTLPDLNAHEIGTVQDGKALVSLYSWIVPGYYDVEKHVALELVRQPDSASEWKIRAVKPMVHGK
jgi:hypothetical protein